jgi:hypothetical protein
MGDVIESKALKILENYEGGNNYILELKERFLKKKNFFPTRTQADYIIKYSNKNPKIARKWVKLDSYFANKIANDRLLIQIPDKIWIEKLLAEKDKAYHIWGKFFDDEKLTHFWMPKGSLIKDNTVKDVVIDFEKYSNRPPLNHQKEAIQKLVENKKFILADSMGLGKAEFIDNQVFTPNGRKKIGDLNVGDKVIGSNGESCSVIGVFPQGVKDLYRVTFSDGMSVLVCKEHLFSVQKNTKNKELVLSVEQMINKDLIIECYGSGHNKDKKYQFTSYYKANSNNNKWQIPIVKPIKFKTKQLPINPYILGLILGDGSITGKSIRFSTSDVEIVKYIENLLPDDLQLKKEINTKYDYRITKKTGNFNSLIQELKKLNLMGCNSSTKFIPDIFKYSSVNDRLEILKGLMDTDGYCAKSKKNNFNGTGFSTVSKKLCDDVVEIVHSLGGIARVSSKIPTYKYKNEIRQGKLAYKVNIKLPEGMNPFKMTRKYELYNTPKKYKIARYIKDIKFEGQGEAVCISVDSPDNLYVTENAVVTHNTTSTIIAALETKAKKILIVCPATLKINWKREIENYTDKSIYICDGKSYDDNHDIIIMNYDIVKNFHDPKNKENSKILKSNFDLLILDEAHLAKNPQAIRTKLINDIAKDIERLWLLTGTPMTSRPIDYYNLLNLVESPVANNWMAYVVRYCAGYQFKAGNRKVWNVMGASNLEELRERTSNSILRRLKENVLDLPEKIITPIYLRLNSVEYENVMGEYYNWYDKNPEESKSLTVQFTKITKVRQIIADEKVKNTIEIAENIIEQGKKVIIFCNFTDSLNKIYEHFKKTAVKLDGSMTKNARQNSVDEFQNNEKIKVFVGNIKAAGVGITLTAAEAVIMNDLSFLPSDHAQAEDRAYRYGQKNSVLVYYPIFENTIEGIIYDIINEKKKVIATVMGDNVGTTEAAEQILNKINSLRK